MKVNITKKDTELLQKMFKELVSFKYQASLSTEEQIQLGNLAYKLGLFVG